MEDSTRLHGKELEAFAKVLDNPAKPVLAILGGAKVRSLGLRIPRSGRPGQDVAVVVVENSRQLAASRVAVSTTTTTTITTATTN